MTHRPNRFAFVLTLGAAVLGLTTGASAYTCGVCTKTVSPGVDLQAEINGLLAGDVLCLNAGVYKPPATLLLTKPIAIQGVQCGVDPQPRYGTTRIFPTLASESIIDGGLVATPLKTIIRIMADDVTLDGLVVRHGTGDLIESLKAAPVKKKPAIRNCIVYDSALPGDEAIQLRNTEDAIIEQNFVPDIAQDAFTICCDSTRGTIQCNEVHNSRSENAAIYVYQAENGNTNHPPYVIDVSITDNLIDNTRPGGGTLAAGIILGIQSFSTPTSTDGTTKDQADTGGEILRNVVRGTTKVGIYSSTSNTEIANNNISDVAGYPDRKENKHGGITIASNSTTNIPAHDILVRDNRVENCGPSFLVPTTPPVLLTPTPGIRIGSTVAVDQPTVVTVTGNTIDGNERGLIYWNATPPPLDAKKNFWGDVAGPRGDPDTPLCGAPLPNLGDTVSCNVDYSDFKSGGTASALPCTITQLPGSACGVAELQGNVEAPCGQQIFYAWTAAPGCPGSLSPLTGDKTTLTLESPCNAQCAITLNVSDNSTPPLTGTCALAVTPGQDPTKPVLTKGTIAACYATRPLAEAAALAATTVSDNCPPVTKSVTSVGDCAAVITVTATDRCGNFDSVTYNTRIDNTPPVLTKGTIAACYPTAAAAQAAAIAATTVNENCPGAVTWSASTSGTCSATVTLRATDGCGNISAPVVYTTRIDATPPVVTKGMIAACYPSVMAAQSAALAATSAVDNCPGPITWSASTVGSCAATVTITATDGCGNSTSVNYATRIDGTKPTVPKPILVPFPSGVLRPPAAACASPSSRSAVIRCSAVTDNCDPSPTRFVQFRTENIDVPSVPTCRTVEDVIPVACDEIVIIHLQPRSCPEKTSIHKPAVEIKGSYKIIRGVSVVLEQIGTDSCGNCATAKFDPTVEPQPIPPPCEQQQLPTYNCCPSMSLPLPLTCRVPLCSVVPPIPPVSPSCP